MSLWTKLARIVAPQSVLNWQTKRDPLTRNLIIAVNHAFYSKDDPQDPINQYLRTRPEDVRTGMVTYLLGRIEKLSDATDQRHATRQWVVAEAFEYSPIRAFFQANASYSEDVSAGTRHPHALGLWELASEIVPVLLTERLKKHGSVSAVLDDMRLESLWLHAKLHFANIGRITLEDRASFREVDWYHALLNLLVARAELALRSRLGAPDDAAAASVDNDVDELLAFLGLSRSDMPPP